MKLPKCRTCGHCHRLGPCPAVGLSEVQKSEAGIPATLEKHIPSVPGASVDGIEAVQGGTGRKSPDDIGQASEEKACRTAALTPAQKQKAYRERHGDKVREANKLRMRRKRGG